MDVCVWIRMLVKALTAHSLLGKVNRKGEYNKSRDQAHATFRCRYVNYVSKMFETSEGERRDACIRKCEIFPMARASSSVAAARTEWEFWSVDQSCQEQGNSRMDRHCPWPRRCPNAARVRRCRRTLSENRPRCRSRLPCLCSDCSRPRLWRILKRK